MKKAKNPKQKRYFRINVEFASRAEMEAVKAKAGDTVKIGKFLREIVLRGLEIEQPRLTA